MNKKTAVRNAPPIPVQSSRDTNRLESEESGADVVAVPILSLHAADSPRLNGEDKAHVKRLAETDAPLPPILVDGRTMRVIDGMHRLMAASLQGRDTIDVIFFHGPAEDVFLRAVEQNVTHGLPLSLADRKAAAMRIVMSHPHLSNGAIAQATGLATKTVEAVRKGSADPPESSAKRVGRDGKLRPLDSSDARRKAAELLTEQPRLSVRDVARAVGMSPATVLDVRRRLSQGESPIPQGAAADTRAVTATAPARASAASARAFDNADGTYDSALDKAPAAKSGQETTPGARAPEAGNPAATVEKLLRDPSFRGSEHGKAILRLLHINAIAAGQLRAAEGVPPHCVLAVLWLARQYSKMWGCFAQELESRARITDPSAQVAERNPRHLSRRESLRWLVP
jgi:transposase-like protein